MRQTRVTGTFNLQPYVIDYSLPAMKAWRKLPEKFPAEVINNKLYVSPSPTLYHSLVCETIVFEVRSYIKANNLGDVWGATIDTFLEGKDKGVVIPDLIFIAKDNPVVRERRGLFGVPDLVIEVLSPGTRKYNFTTKKNLYERTGVKEYWLIDPETKDATGYQLKEGAYGNPLLMNSKIHVRIFNKEICF